MNASTLVVDASLVVRRVLFPDDRLVQTMWESWESAHLNLVAPGLLFYEVTNAIYRYHHLGWLSAETTKSALSAALALPIRLESDLDLHRRAWSLAVRYQLPAAYDAHYLALAELLDVEYFTTNRKFYQRLKPEGVERIQLISVG